MILIVLLILIASFSGFKIISILSDYKKASDTYTEAEKNFVKKPETMILQLISEKLVSTTSHRKVLLQGTMTSSLRTENSL